MPITASLVIGIIATLVCTILSVIMITPASKRNKLPKFFQFLHDIFNFKTLFIEKILKFFYILLTLGCVIIGFLMLFSGTYYEDFWSGTTHFTSTFLPGLIIMIVGPIAVRITYESLMMFILLVQNTIEINSKLTQANETATAEQAEYVEQPVVYPYCPKCGTQYDPAYGCPNCKQ